MPKTRTTIAVLIGLAMITSACVVPSAGAGTITTATEPPPPGPTTTTLPDATETTVAETTTTTEPPPPSIDPEVEPLLRSIASWQVPTVTSVDGRVLSADTWDIGKTRTSCLVDQPRTLSRAFDEFAAFPFSGPLAPGLIVEGSGVVEGDLRVVPLDRAPLTLVSSLDSENPTIAVDAPTTSSIQEAISALKRDADAQFTGVDITPADITFVREEVHSYEEAMLGMGVSLHYDSPGLRTKFESSFEQESRSEKHSIVASLVQPMFTVRADTSRIDDAADWFAVTTSTSDVERLISNGAMGDGNPPVVIDSVTYGRVMYFTMTSSLASDSSELIATMEAAYGGLGGEAGLTDRQRSVLNESRLEVIAFGGDQDVAFQALKSGRLNDFFASVNTTTAAPLSMTVRTLTGELVEVADEATLQSVSCSETTLPYAFGVEVRNLNGRAIIKVNDVQIADWSNHSGLRTIDVPANRLRPGANSIKIEYSDWFPCSGSSITATILRDGSRVGSSAKEWDAPACWFDLTWDINTNGTVVARP